MYLTKFIATTTHNAIPTLIVKQTYQCKNLGAMEYEMLTWETCRISTKEEIYVYGGSHCADVNLMLKSLTHSIFPKPPIA